MTKPGRLQSLMIAHGAMVLLAGMFSGLPFAFNLLGAIELWPIPFRIDVQIPGTERGWRAAHIGNILNGTMVMAIGAVLPALRLPDSMRPKIAWSLIITAWGNAVFYVAAVFTTGRALSFGENRHGGGDWFNSIGYLTAMVAVFTVIFALVQVVRGGLAAAAEATED